MSRKNVYSLLCILGFVFPYSKFVPWVMMHGLDWRLFLAELSVNRISGFFAADVLVSAVVLVIFMRLESRRLGVRFAWVAVMGLCLVGVSLGLPLYLYLRELALNRVAREDNSPLAQRR
jgi:Terpene cyclase DEP1